MNEDTTLEMVKQVISARSDEELALIASDAGRVGEYAREELTARGHEVTYSNVNGVQEAKVLLMNTEVMSDQELDEMVTKNDGTEEE